MQRFYPSFCGWEVCVCVFELTSEDGAELSPAGDPSLRGVLAQCDFQEEHRQTTPEKEDEVRDKKCTWGNSSTIEFRYFVTLILIFFFYSICCASITYRHHFYNKGKGSARRFLIRQSLRPRTGQSRAYWPTSPAEELCLLPHPQVSYLGSSLVKVSECPCESPSDIEASLFVPCCRQRKKDTMIQTKGERWAGGALGR